MTAFTPSDTRLWLLGLAADMLTPDDRARPPGRDALEPALAALDGRLLPVTVAGLRTAGVWADLSQTTRTSLQQRSFSAVALHLRQQAWLQRFLCEQRPADLPVLLLKGVAFNGACYGAEAPRAGGDIDLLARPEDFERLCALLDRIATPVALYAGRPFSCGTRFERGYWIDREHTLCVEPHRHLVQPGLVTLDPATLWRRSVPHPTLARDDVRSLEPADAVLHLAAHALTNQNCAPHALVDAARMARTFPLDLALLRERAAACGIGLVLDEFLGRVAESVQGAATLFPVRSVHGLRRAWSRRAMPVDRRSDDGARAAFRGRQMLALALLDRPLQTVPFLLRYAALRARDLFAASGVRTATARLTPEELGGRFVRYRGISMYPTLRDRDLLRIEPLGAGKPRVGDILVFAGAEPGHWIVHRVVAIRGGRIMTRGDNNDRIDAVLPTPETTRGRVVAVCRAAGDVPVSGGPRGCWVGGWMRLRNRLARRLAGLRRGFCGRNASLRMRQAEG